MREKIRHGGILRCDMEGCDHLFPSYSMLSLIRKQASADGWGRPKLNRLEDWQTLELGSNGRKLLDMCPGCAAKITAEYARRKIASASERAAKKAAQLNAKRIRESRIASKRRAATPSNEVTVSA